MKINFILVEKCLEGFAEINLKNEGFYLNGDLELWPILHSNGKMLPLLYIVEDLEVKVYNTKDVEEIDYVVNLFESTYLPVILDKFNTEVPEWWNNQIREIMND